MFLIFARPRECLRTTQECYEHLQISCELAPNCIHKPIRKHIRIGVRAALNFKKKEMHF